MSNSNLVSEIFKGTDVSGQYNLLDDEHKLGVCNEVCVELSKQLDAENKENITTVGKFMQIPSLEHVLTSMKANVGLDRMIKFAVDEDPEFGKVIDAINKSPLANGAPGSSGSGTASTETDAEEK